MSSRSKNRQTFSKMARERAVKEKRELKQEKKDAKKAAAANAAEEAAATPDGNGAAVDEPGERADVTR